MKKTMVRSNSTKNRNSMKINMLEDKLFSKL